MTQQLAQLQNISYSYSNNRQQSSELILDNIDLSINEGEIICLLGASGCGKTTLLNIIAGLLIPDSGTRSLNQKLRSNKNSVGYIFQQDALLPWRTVEKNLELPNHISRKKVSSADFNATVIQHIYDFNLDRSVLQKFPSELSGGMRQRISIIQALMAEPRLLLLDEPFSALDLHTKMDLEEDFWALIQNSNRAAVLVTHDIEQAIALSTQIIIMDAHPGNIAHIHNIDPSMRSGKGPKGARGSTGFGDYFNTILKEMRALMEHSL